jgi:hypothetical protein
LPEAADALLAAQALALALVVPLLMCLSLGRLRALLEPRRAPPAPDPAREARIVRVVPAVLRRARPVLPRHDCLVRGVTLYYFLRRAGVDVTLCFGLGPAARDADAVSGHCWLARGDHPYLEAGDPRTRFAVLYTIPRAREAAS